MYVKTLCPYCKQDSYIDIRVKIITEKASNVLGNVEVIDTLKEEDLIKIVSNRLSQNSTHFYNWITGIVDFKIRPKLFQNSGTN